MEYFKGLTKLINFRIRFKTNEGEFEGVVRGLCNVLNVVLIDHALLLPAREYMGNLRFSIHEIKSYSCVKRNDTKEQSAFGYSSSVRNCPENFDLADLCEVVDSETEDEYKLSVEDFQEDEYVLKLPESLLKQLPGDSAILDSVNDEFQNAVQCISKERLIGVSFEGPKISRIGILSWVCISVPTCTFLFDIGSLKKEAFDSGLRSIFEDRNIEKVIHDCRQPADCLFHQFKTCLVNVFDTQVADYIVQMQRSRSPKVLQYVSSLNTCVFQHLDVPNEYLHQPKQHKSESEKIISYNLRPISNEFRDFAIKNVIYLRLLKEKLFNLLMTPFNQSVDIYLKVLASSEVEEISLGISNPNELPPALLMEGIKTVCFHDFIDIPHPLYSGNHDQKLRNPVKDFIDSLKDKRDKMCAEYNISRATTAKSRSDCNFKDLKNEEENSYKSLISIDQTFFDLMESEQSNSNFLKYISVNPEMKNLSIIQGSESTDSNCAKNVELPKEFSLKFFDQTQSNNSYISKSKFAESSAPVDNIDIWEKLCSNVTNNSDNFNIINVKKLNVYPG